MKPEIKISVEEFDKLNESYQNLSSQIDKLATFIMENIEGEPSRSEGAIDCAIRLLGNQKNKGNDFITFPFMMKKYSAHVNDLVNINDEFKLITGKNFEELLAEIKAGTATIEHHEIEIISLKDVAKELDRGKINE